MDHRGDVSESLVAERLSPTAAAAFDELSVSQRDRADTLLCGTVRDQSHLHGVLARFQMLGLTLDGLARVHGSAGRAADPSGSTARIRPEVAVVRPSRMSWMPSTMPRYHRAEIGLWEKTINPRNRLANATWPVHHPSCNHREGTEQHVPGRVATFERDCWSCRHRASLHVGRRPPIRPSTVVGRPHGADP